MTKTLLELCRAAAPLVAVIEALEAAGMKMSDDTPLWSAQLGRKSSVRITPGHLRALRRALKGE